MDFPSSERRSGGPAGRLFQCRSQSCGFGSCRAAWKRLELHRKRQWFPMHSAGLLRKATALGAAFFLLSAEMPAAADNLVAHHARYVLSLSPDSKNSQI